MAHGLLELLPGSCKWACKWLLHGRLLFSFASWRAGQASGLRDLSGYVRAEQQRDLYQCTLLSVLNRMGADARIVKK